jgi:methylene-tetrahydromethanopterin dehydrogenase
MQPLELEPVKGKKLKLILVESEHSIEWWLEPPPKTENDFFSHLKFISREYTQFIEDLVQKHQPQFAVEERGLRTQEEFLYDNPLIDVFKHHHIPHEMVDIPENALNYIESTLYDRRALLKSIKKEILNTLGNEKQVQGNQYLQQLVQWGEYLQTSYDIDEDEIRYKIREAWMLMNILTLAKKQETKEVIAMFICDKNHFEGITVLADELGIELTKIALKKVFKDLSDANSLKALMNSSIFEIMPIKVKKQKKEEKILYFFDTDEYASPFDINMAYDAGFDVVVPFSKVTAQTVTKLVQDAIFSRGPQAPTTFFIGGSNVKEGEKVAKQVLKALVPPFEVPVVVDPRGSHTTASAVVAKTLTMANEHGIENLAGKKVVVLGTGPVGRIAAIIAAKLHCKTVLVETWDGASEESVKALAQELRKEAGDDASEITGEFATTDAQKTELLTDADVIWALAAAGVQILSQNLMTQLPPTKLVIDINAVPPLGVEGLKPKNDNKEIYPGIFGTGALALGGLKYQIESNILKQAAQTKGKKVFDYNLAFEIGQALLVGKKIVIESK